MSAAKSLIERRSFLEKLYITLNQRQGFALFNELLQNENIKPRIGVSTFLVYLIAAVVQLFVIIFLVLGVLILFYGYRHIVTIVLSLIFFVLAWFARPRFNKLPEHPINRNSSPSLHGMIDSLAKKVGTRIDLIEITEDFNASTYLASWRQLRVLSIGLPLWVILSDDEKVALICHELAHNINGDVTNSVFMGVTMTSLNQWYILLSPHFDSRKSILEILIDIFFAMIAQIPRFFLNIIYILSWRVHQRAEYMADLMSARVCGTNAYLGLASKLDYSKTFESIVRVCALSSNPESNIFRELEKSSFSRKGINSLEDYLPDTALDWSIDPYHPPMPLRLRYLKAKFYAQGNIELPAEVFTAIDGEIELEKARINKRLINLYRASIQ